MFFKLKNVIYGIGYTCCDKVSATDVKTPIYTKTNFSSYIKTANILFITVLKYSNKTFSGFSRYRYLLLHNVSMPCFTTVVR